MIEINKDITPEEVEGLFMAKVTHEAKELASAIEQARRDIAAALERITPLANDVTRWLVIWATCDEYEMLLGGKVDTPLRFAWITAEHRCVLLRCCGVCSRHDGEKFEVFWEGHGNLPINWKNENDLETLRAIAKHLQLWPAEFGKFVDRAVAALKNYFEQENEQ